MTLPDHAALTVEGGSDSGKTIPLANRKTTLGRQSDNDVVVDEPGVSQRHAEISAEVDYYLADLSRNGTYVNGKNLSEGVHLLNDGDRFTLGPSELTFIFRMSLDQAEVVLDGGGRSGEATPLIAGRTTFGRQSDNDVVVDELGVSRQHAEISTDVSYFLTDLTFGDGIHVNGESLSEGVHLLNDGDRFTLSPSEVSFIFRSRASDTLIMALPTVEG